jgi:hypothetical protein
MRPQACTILTRHSCSRATTGLAAVSQVCGAIRDNDLAAAEGALTRVQEITTKLMLDVAEKASAGMQAPMPDKGDGG